MRLLSAFVARVRHEPLGSLSWRFDGVEEDQGGRGGWRAPLASQTGQEQAAEDERRCVRIVSRALISAPVLRVRDKPPGSSMLRFEGAWRDQEEDGVR